MDCRKPLMSPRTQITRARELLIRGRRKESYGLWIEAREAYREGRVAETSQLQRSR